MGVGGEGGVLRLHQEFTLIFKMETETSKTCPKERN